MTLHLTDKEFFTQDGVKMVRITSPRSPGFAAIRREEPGDRPEAPQTIATEEVVSAVDELDGLTKAELIDYAEEHGIEIDPKSKKTEILKAVRAAD